MVYFAHGDEIHTTVATGNVNYVPILVGLVAILLVLAARYLSGRNQ